MAHSLAVISLYTVPINECYDNYFLSRVMRAM